MANLYSNPERRNSNQYVGNFGATGYNNEGSTSHNGVGGSGFQPQERNTFTNNVQQWQAQPQVQSYGHPSQQQSQQQHLQQNAEHLWTSNVQQAAVGFMAQAATGNITIEKVLDPEIDEIPGMKYIMGQLRSYFAVDNRYVKRKMLIVLFPFINKEWRREVQEHGPEKIVYSLPHSDENAPDLYIPVMSLITYCLLSAFLYGTAGQFNPEVIADVITKCFVTQILEVVVIRGCLYTMQAPIPFLDLFSYTGYKYLGLTISMLCGIVFKHLEWGTASFYGAFLWTASAAAWFIQKTMNDNIPLETASTGPKREIMVLAFAASQVATMWFVSQTKYL